MTPTIIRRGCMFVLSSPSGAGKTTISRHLLSRDQQIHLSISVTTRTQRPAEIQGTHYRFVSEAEFKRMRENNELLEHAQVFGNFYGTPRAPVEKALSAGQDVLFDIDWQGTQQLAEKARDDLVSVFVLPPSWQELEQRLRSRAQDSADVIAHRMSRASHEMSHWAEYDYIIVNHELEKSVNQVYAILTAERLKRRRQVGLSNFVRELMKG